MVVVVLTHDAAPVALDDQTASADAVAASQDGARDSAGAARSEKSLNLNLVGSNIIVIRHQTFLARVD
jgi:hypothetical protein